MLLPARCERVATCLNRNVAGDTFPTLSSLDKPVGRSMEQRVNLKFLVKVGKTFTEACAMLKEVHGNGCLSRTQVFEWFKRFKEGRETTEDDPRRGRPSTSKTDENIENVGKLIREDRCPSIRGLAEITGIDKECVRLIWHESFNMRRVCAKMAPILLTTKQKESRMNICADIRNNIDTDPGLLDTVLNQLTDADFQHCYQQWKSRMERCRDLQGESIEGEQVATDLTVTDDTVLEEHNEDPALVQMRLIGDGE
ncbi:hypothetical protein NQ318_006499 [Aromia moschata]|uniref:Mos1 transposase HTH domain-containing protein n=1 Tax=Aromia moschata TaxID=1265417 RepID=A0AAV8YN02_9CUCU|nr:hypothetical protein NQ318_006499 [Aromia moschata]